MAFLCVLLFLIFLMIFYSWRAQTVPPRPHPHPPIPIPHELA